MNRNCSLLLKTLLIVIILGLPLLASGKNPGSDECEGIFRNTKVTEEELKEVLRLHAEWQSEATNLSTEKYLYSLSDARRANLCEADLSGADLKGAALSQAVLSRADLSGAILQEADLSGATLDWTILRDADLRKADLNLAKMRGANLGGADLGGANLSGTILSEADLSGAILKGTSLDGAFLEKVDLSAFYYDGIEPGKHPRLASLDGKLFRMRFTDSPESLIELRKAFKETGLHEQARELTYAIKHSERLILKEKGGLTGKIKSMLSYIFFELTTGWGMSPARALWILVILFMAFSFPYIIALRNRGGDAGIWRVRSEKKLRGDIKTGGAEALHEKWPKAIVLGIYLSLLSPFRLGFRDFTLSNVIARIKKREFILRATGWVKVVSGVQSIISVYLIAIWALTYFGRPFE